MKNSKKVVSNKIKQNLDHESWVCLLIISLILISVNDQVLLFIIFYLIIICSIIKRDKQEEEKEISKKYKNIIIGEIEIKPEDVNKDIQIINSYENIKRINNYENDEDDLKNENEKEIKKNIRIKINGKLIQFSYTYKFKKEGKYLIEYAFKINLTNTNHLFCNCRNITNLNLTILKILLICIACLAIVVH